MQSLYLILPIANNYSRVYLNFFSLVIKIGMTGFGQGTTTLIKYRLRLLVFIMCDQAAYFLISTPVGQVSNSCVS